jgi:predicted  nucleic acid-binding Zn-ribbon protein
MWLVYEQETNEVAQLQADIQGLNQTKDQKQKEVEQMSRQLSELQVDIDAKMEGIFVVGLVASDRYLRLV